MTARGWVLMPYDELYKLLRCEVVQSVPASGRDTHAPCAPRFDPGGCTFTRPCTSFPVQLPGRTGVGSRVCCGCCEQCITYAPPRDACRACAVVASCVRCSIGVHEGAYCDEQPSGQSNHLSQAEHETRSQHVDHQPSADHAPRLSWSVSDQWLEATLIQTDRV